MTNGNLGQRKKGWRQKSLGLGIWFGAWRDLSGVQRVSLRNSVGDFLKFISNWRIIALQGCAGFHHTTV